jgi:hypothetical protein
MEYRWQVTLRAGEYFRIDSALGFGGCEYGHREAE